MKSDQHSGTFIVIEGPDASGKQTQTERIVKWLRDLNYSNIREGEEKKLIDQMPGKYPSPETEKKVDDSIKNGVWHLSFPTYSQTPGGRIVDAYLKGRLGNHSDLSMEDKVDIYAADRKQFKLLIQEYLSKGGIIVCDRYREANLIHQLVGFEGEEWEEKYRYIKSVDSDLPDADKVFYLDISPEETLHRMKEKEKDMHEEDQEYMRASNINGRKVAEHEGWEIIRAERSRDEIEEDLKRHVRELFDE